MTTFQRYFWGVGKFKVCFIKDKLGGLRKKPKKVLHVVKCKPYETCVSKFFHSYRYGYIQFRGVNRYLKLGGQNVAPCAPLLLLHCYSAKTQVGNCPLCLPAIDIPVNIENKLSLLEVNRPTLTHFLFTAASLQRMNDKLVDISLL